MFINIISMKKIYAILLMGSLLLLNAACESDATLDGTRPTVVESPSVSLANVTLDKYTATFEVSLNKTGNPATREYGVLISSEKQPDLENSTIIAADMAESTATLSTTLSPSTTYYVCAYALTAAELKTSEVESFTTESHYLGTILGTKVLNGYNYHADAEYPITVTFTADEEDETIAYMSGLTSFAGVTLDLAPVKMVFDLEAGTVTIPNGQLVNEPNYGPYQYCIIDPSNFSIILGDNVGTVTDGIISFTSLAACILEGMNAGLPHFLYFDVVIQ